MSYSLYNTFSDLIVTKDDYAEAEAFTQQYLNTLYPTLDLREGSPLRDIVIRPSATMIALVNKGVTKYFNDNTLAGATNDTPTETVDALLSNLFLTRNTGTSTKITAQLRFSTAIPSTSVSVPITTTFSVDNVSNFTPVEATTLSLSDGTLQLYSDNTGAQYYFGNITLESEDPGSASQVNVDQELLFFTIFDAYFLGAKVKSISTVGVDPETNLEFISRSSNAISTRNLINSPSIANQVNALFPQVRSLLVSGMGEYEQFRDYRLLPLSTSPYPVPIHLGGYVDVYCKTFLREKLVRFTTGVDGKALSSFNQPIVNLSLAGVGEKAVDNDDGSPVTSVDPTIVITDINDLLIEDLQYTSPVGVIWEQQTGFSTMQRIQVSSAGVAFPASSTLDLRVLYWDSLDSIQSYFTDPQTRVISGNYLARGFNTVELLPTIRIVGGAPTDPLEKAEAIAAIVTALDQYLETLGASEAFVFADALGFITSRVTQYQFNNSIDIRTASYFSKAGQVSYAVSPSSGVLDSNYLINNSSNHDEEGTTKVRRTFVFYVRARGVTLL